jgi:ubiquinone/menaquinone biosynthesis C-methylase UbiE
MLAARIQQQAVPDLYRKLAPVYDAWAWLTESRSRERCLSLAAIQDGESVLEVAVGTGLAFEKILAVNPSGRNEGIDLAESMLLRAKKRAFSSGAHYRLRIGSAYALDYPNDSFDVLINNYMFDLLPEEDFVSVLTEFKRVLKPGGRLHVAGMTPGEHAYNAIWEWVFRLNPAWLGGCRGIQLEPFLKEAGYVDTGREFISQMTFPSEIVYGSTPDH